MNNLVDFAPMTEMDATTAAYAVLEDILAERRDVYDAIVNGFAAEHRMMVRQAEVEKAIADCDFRANDKVAITAETQGFKVTLNNDHGRLGFDVDGLTTFTGREAKRIVKNRAAHSKFSNVRIVKVADLNQHYQERLAELAGDKTEAAFMSGDQSAFESAVAEEAELRQMLKAA